MKRLPCWFVVILTFVFAAFVPAQDKAPIRVLDEGALPKDSRLGKPKDLNGYFPLTPPTTKEAWEARRKVVRDQILVATGLWPMPEKLPLQPVIHGKIDRDDYTIEKVFFASYPGHYVSGNLYRPKGKTGKLAGVLCPHGHWHNGRFYEAGEAEVQKQVEQGAEKTPNGARYPLQARCAQLARMGCVVFHYDMVGVADSKSIEHTAGFTDPLAELCLLSFMGLQTFNSIRALDFLVSLPDVDPTRIGVTGASGGGTQTFILCAIDNRPSVAFPAVMVSTAMQGGCICENCSYLRQDTGNIEIAGLFAPRPLGMTGADDWTREIETKGLPELKELYKLYSAENRVMAKCFPQFGHNYNQVSREVMYNWFNKYLRLQQPMPVVEKPFTPVPPKELSVYDETHPRPQDAANAEMLRKYMTEASDKQMAAIHPNRHLKEFRHVVGTALRVMIHDQLPNPEEVEGGIVSEEKRDKVRIVKLLLGRKNQEEQIPALLVAQEETIKSVVVWVHPQGKASLMPGGNLTPAVKQILKTRTAILAPDVFLTGEFMPSPPPAVDAKYAGYTFAYNRPLLANRVHDILTAIAFARGVKGVKNVDLAGFQEAGPWVILVVPCVGTRWVGQTADVDGFSFEKVHTLTDEMMLPGALKYGGLPAFAALCVPGDLYLHNDPDSRTGKFARDAYLAAGLVQRLLLSADKASPDKVAKWLVR